MCVTIVFRGIGIGIGMRIKRVVCYRRRARTGGEQNATQKIRRCARRWNVYVIAEAQERVHYLLAPLVRNSVVFTMTLQVRGALAVAIS